MRKRSRPPHSEQEEAFDDAIDALDQIAQRALPNSSDFTQQISALYHAMAACHAAISERLAYADIVQALRSLRIETMNRFAVAETRLRRRKRRLSFLLFWRRYGTAIVSTLLSAAVTWSVWFWWDAVSAWMEYAVSRLLDMVPSPNEESKVGPASQPPVGTVTPRGTQP
ncbi:hypothetical protein [Poseidonocella sedimentorum]|uniref:hypothetical protein n=1 Tax=Poseidonocella sedimentorum TaxID=871652 RepID=UPI000B89D3AD|nr:hypothetical protein [Poseidonocella sedimentorum]